MEKKLHVKTGDKVIVISGASKGVIGKVLDVSEKEGKVMVEKAHMISKHVKPRKQGESGQIVEVEGAIYADKVMLYCDKCGAGRRYRTAKPSKTKSAPALSAVRSCKEVARYVKT